jgi:hypothetical protein
MTNQIAPSTLQLKPWQRVCFSFLSICILATIFWCNLPDSFTAATRTAMDRHLDPQFAYKVRWTAWVFRYAAHIAGLDNKWQMFGGQSRFNWKFLIVAEYGESTDRVERLLPLPRQGDRSFFQKSVIDFKEAKFHLNIYNDPVARESYARYLGREYPEYQGRSLKSIRYDLQVQNIIPPLIAVKEQKLLEEKIITNTISRFSIEQEVQRALAKRISENIGTVIARQDNNPE